MPRVRAFWLIFLAGLLLACSAGTAGADPNDPYWPPEWGPRLTRASDLWNLTTGNPSIVIAVVDTGLSQPLFKPAGQSTPVADLTQVVRRLEHRRQQRRHHRHLRPRHLDLVDHRRAREQRRRVCRLLLALLDHAGAGRGRARRSAGREHRRGDPLGSRPRSTDRERQPRKQPARRERARGPGVRAGARRSGRHRRRERRQHRPPLPGLVRDRLGQRALGGRHRRERPALRAGRREAPGSTSPPPAARR